MTRRRSAESPRRGTPAASQGFPPRRFRPRGYNSCCRRTPAAAVRAACPSRNQFVGQPADASPRRVVVLGSSGSIGTNTLDVIAALPDRFQVHGLAVHRSLAAVVDQAHRFRPAFVCVTDPDAARDLDRDALPPGTRLLAGPDAVREMVTDPAVDVVVAAVVGAAGLTGTWAALEAGKTVALANKETLVVGGPLVMDLAARHGGRILPVDSEHSAIFQALAGSRPEDVRRIVLTASGGPFRGYTPDRLADVTPDDALRHPTWRMGPKISVDSATLMNKALEVIEARWLFGLPADRIDVIIHPESLIHSFVEYVDGSVMAQLSPPDMRLPIQYALTYPERITGPARRLDWSTLGTIHFEAPDRATFPALDLGFEVARVGGTAGAALNAANEAAVGRFLAGDLAFTDIPRACRAAIDQHHFSASPTLEELWATDRRARIEVDKWKNTTRTTTTC
ncbi:MAG: 1-deoxy-D-xylulose-5-phosphate reductoisomerase [Gemmataceae bacterium]|nr:1-deoxy-D-xylulose-5-phosphate reductoisomerase [Gemmataceae bacterium]